MANQKYLDILKQGGKVWNDFWENGHGHEPDLSKADLSNIDLSGALLYGADFFEANLEGVNFTDAGLSDVSFSFANLTHSNLTNAHLPGVNFQKSNLSYACFAGAYVTHCNFEETILNNTSFTDAELHWCKFANVDLSNTVGLDEIYYLGLSYIDIFTIYRSKGKIPSKFLQESGIPDKFINAIPSLLLKNSKFHSCFISFSNHDYDFAKKIQNDLRNRGVRCWFAPKDMKIGQKIRQSIDDSIQLYDKLLTVLSINSIKSEWVEKEIETAFEKERDTNNTVLFPIRIDSSVFDTNKSWAADIRRSRHIGDFERWEEPECYKKSLERLINDLDSEE